MTLTEKMEKLEVNLPLLKRDLNNFIRGRARFNQIKRWVAVVEDATEREDVADYIAARIRGVLLDEPADEEL